MDPDVQCCRADGRGLTGGAWLSRGGDYALLALESATLGDDLQLPMELFPGGWALPTSPVPYDDYLKRKLGEVRESTLSRSTLVLFLTAQAGSAHDLQHQVRELWSALLLQGSPNYKNGQVLEGSILDGRLSINRVQDQHPHYPYFFGLQRVVTRGILETAAVLTTRIRRLFERDRGENFRRLRRGFLAWYGGILEKEPEPRLHQFVRSLEGITRAGGSADHVRRGQLFVGTSQRSQDLLAELYRLRNCAEHLNHFRKALPTVPEADLEQHASRSCHEAEVLASHVYLRIFSNLQMLARAETDDEVSAFWALAPADREAIWGPTIDLESVAARSFIPPA